jgi:hypothetical protein
MAAPQPPSRELRALRQARCANATSFTLPRLRREDVDRGDRTWLRRRPRSHAR